MKQLTDILATLYGTSGLDGQVERYQTLQSRFEAAFSTEAPQWFSASGRTELSGNHTDHNQGCVLAATVQLDTVAAAVPSDDMICILDSEGYPPVQVDLTDLSVQENEAGDTASLVRGVAARFVELGVTVRGFRAVSTSNVLKGSGLSSSAALEVLVGCFFNAFYNDNAFDSVLLAQIGQFAENVYFMKPCGLMDQVASAHGGIVSIDFADKEVPKVDAVDYDFGRRGYTLAVVDTGGNHADLTPEYAAVPADMKRVAALLGQEVLRGLSHDDLLAQAADIRSQCGDRAFLRAWHFVGENQRVGEQLAALKADDIELYLKLVRESGRSSFEYLQNVYAASAPDEQGISLALALTEQFLNGQGACRVHGGGFAGTIQVYVPNERVEAYRAYIEGVFGPGTFTPLHIRALPAGPLD